MATILVIDDSVSVLCLMENLLEHSGHRILTSSNGKQGLEILEETPVDLIITDIYMPDQDGLELIRGARQIRPEARVIAMSARSEPLNMFKAAVALGASSTLQKPFSNEQLLTAIMEALNKPPPPSPEEDVTDHLSGPPREPKTALNPSPARNTETRSKVWS